MAILPELDGAGLFPVILPQSTDLHSVISPSLLLLPSLHPPTSLVFLARHCAFRGRVSVTVHFPLNTAATKHQNSRPDTTIFMSASARSGAQQAHFGPFGETITIKMIRPVG